MAALVLWLAWPVFADSFRRGEMSTDAGGLIRWPVKALMPMGFLLLLLQGISELIKRTAYLSGRLTDPFAHPAEPASHTAIVDPLPRDKSGQ